MDVLIKALQLIASLSLLVMVHEFGHFFFAKLFKCRVEKFYLFFNPYFSLFKFKKGETEYGLGWLPLGGYVKIAGMVDESMDTEQLKQPAQPWEFRSKPAWQRLLIMIGGVLMNVITAFVIYVCMTLSYGKSVIKNSDVTSGYEYSEVALELGFKNGDKIVSIGGKTYEDSNDIMNAFIFEDIKSAIVNRDGKEVAIDFEFDYRKALLESKQPFLSLRVPLLIDSVANGMAAEISGIQSGDIIIAVNGEKVEFNDQLSPILKNSINNTLSITVIRDSLGTKVNKSLTLIMGDTPIMGIFFNPYLDKYYTISEKEFSIIEAIPEGVNRTIAMVDNYIKQLKLIVSPETGAYKQVGSVVSMANFFPATWNWVRFWDITALFSIMLAVMNMLPIPALDGGHVLFLLYEVITGRTPSDKFMEVMQTIGIIFLLALMVFAFGNDIFKLFR